MKTAAALMLVGALFAPAVATAQPEGIHMPYAQAGLTPKQAAAHLLNRFAFGARPGQVDAVAREGVDRWFAEQLRGNAPDPEVDQRLTDLSALNLPDEQISETFLEPFMIKKMGEKEGMFKGAPPADGEARREYGRQLNEYARSKGYSAINELMDQLYTQKIVRAVYGENQMREVLTDFWFNHFNVSRTNNVAKPHMFAYERDAIRPNVFGSFRTLLGATAKHPAMMYYLNNAESVAPQGARRLRPLPRGLERRYGPNSKLGLNENYARELMELHTLGVDGGYKQHDVEQVARAITGWTSYGRGEQVPRFIERIKRGRNQGIIVQGSFYFLPFLHDAGPKTILGQHFPAGHGLDEGERVLDLLSMHPSTARFIARKLATRFVGDHPDPKLVARLARRYLETRGDLTQEYIAIVDSPEFWAPAARRSKVKTAFEYVISGIRALDANLVENNSRPLDAGNTTAPVRRSAFARTLPQWLDRMGQPLYGYQAPTGFPDRAEIWVSSGSIVNRINFAFALATHRLGGVQIDNDPLLALQGTPVDQRVATLASSVLPGRDTAETIKLVKSNMDNPEFLSRIQLAPKNDIESEKPKHKRFNARLDFSETEKIVGILISSPEFQRR